MIYETKIFQGLFFLDRSLFQLAKAEQIDKLIRKIIWLFVICALTFSISGWFGIGTHVLSPEIVKSTHSQYEGMKGLFIIGRALLGLVYAGVILLLPALYFWVFSETAYSKFVVVQAFTLPILLLEFISHIVLAVIFHLPWYSSPLAFGVIAQSLTNIDYLIFLFASISLFKIWVMWIQYQGLRALTSLSKVRILLLIISINLLFWCCTAAFSFINFVKVL